MSTKDVTINGISYEDVPAVDIPITGTTNKARFVEISDTTAVASDVATGKTFYLADGTKATGTNSGGGVIITDTTDTHGGTIREIITENALSISSLNVTSNGTYTGTTTPIKQVWDEVIVNVSGGSGGNVQSNKNVTPTATGLTVTPDTGYDSLAKVTISGDEDLVATNVKKNVNIFGVTGTYSGDPLKMGIIRADAELVTTFSDNKLFVEDLEGTIPAYSTTAQTLAAASNLSTVTNCDFDNYTYAVYQRLLTIPIYNTTTKAKGRPDFCLSEYFNELIEMPQVYSLDHTKSITATKAWSSAAFTRQPYWSSATALSMYTATSYGVYMTGTTPTVSGTTITIKTPLKGMRGSTTYMTSANWDKITDIRHQYIIYVYRAPKIDGMGWLYNKQIANDFSQIYTNSILS